MRPGLGVALALLLASPQARAEDIVLTFACDVSPAAGPPASPDWGSAFSVTVPFGEGESLALLDPESGTVRATVHASDVLAGTLRLPQESATLVWTRAMSRRAPLVGQAVRSDGHLVVLSLGAPQPGGGTRALTLFDTASARAWPGQCKQAP